jgi:hypothetical protein
VEHLRLEVGAALKVVGQTLVAELDVDVQMLPKQGPDCHKVVA